MLDPATIRVRLREVHERIDRAASRAQRDPSTICLVAVSKFFAAQDVRSAAEAGQVHFGESKVQEALSKMDQTADLDLTWHLVGHLQSNKARRAASHFHVIHSVDDAALISKLDEAAGAASRTVQLLIQIDLAGEPTKHGVNVDALHAVLEAARQTHFVRVVGLMLLPPAVAHPEAARPYFTRLRALRDELAALFPDLPLSELSMGMSLDFEVAIEEGATMVRIGSAIFGDRPTHRFSRP